MAIKILSNDGMNVLYVYPGDSLIAAKFTSLNLANANFSNMQLQYAQFYNCNLNGANFSNSNLNAVKFINCIIESTNLNGVDSSNIFNTLDGK
ncbi:hypothetical protein FACS189459_1200 [Bacilli bacterium]|nr:hypothetical protein FACS189459_1200 [Bacilli bacterium]